MTLEDIKKGEKEGFWCPHYNQKGMCIACAFEFMKIANKDRKWRDENK